MTEAIKNIMNVIDEMKNGEFKEGEYLKAMNDMKKMYEKEEMALKDEKEKKNKKEEKEQKRLFKLAIKRVDLEKECLRSDIDLYRKGKFDKHFTDLASRYSSNGTKDEIHQKMLIIKKDKQKRYEKIVVFLELTTEYFEDYYLDDEQKKEFNRTFKGRAEIDMIGRDAYD